eukprot:scaffold455_cov155-Ochromonas_danica.AAC.6
MSTIMQKLSNDAIQKARKMVEDKFKDPNALEDLGTTTFSLEKSLAEVDGQLNGAVQSKLDSLKRAVDLMDESVAKLTTLSSAIARIDERIGQTNTAIAHFPSLMQAANARENLSKVIAQVEFFASIPQRIAALEDRLATRPDQIKDVFVEATKLEALSTALRQEMMRASSSRHSVSSIDGLNPSQEIERYLQPVPRLVNQVMAQVMGSVERMFDLAATHPEDLVTAVEIIEMQQDYNERRNKRILAQQKAKGAQAGPPAKLYEDISASVQQRVRKLLDHVMEGEFEAMPGYLQQSQSQATAFITAANQALFRVKFFQTDVVPCLPPHFDPLFMALEAFDFFFLPHLSDLLDKELGRLKVAEILDVISWLDVYKASLEDLGFPSRDSLTEVPPPPPAPPRGQSEDRAAGGVQGSHQIAGTAMVPEHPVTSRGHLAGHRRHACDESAGGHVQRAARSAGGGAREVARGLRQGGGAGLPASAERPPAPELRQSAQSPPARQAAR